jgi:hypothetical protein
MEHEVKMEARILGDDAMHMIIHHHPCPHPIARTVEVHEGLSDDRPFWGGKLALTSAETPGDEVGGALLTPVRQATTVHVESHPRTMSAKNEFG